MSEVARTRSEDTCFRGSDLTLLTSENDTLTYVDLARDSLLGFCV